MSRRFNAGAIVVGTLAILAVTPASALTLTQDEAAFNAAIAGLTATTEDFEGFAPTANVSSFDTGDFLFEAFNFSLEATDSFCPGLGQCLTNITGGGFTITFDAPVNAVGLFIGDGEGNTSNVIVDGTDLGPATFPGDDGVFTFLGVFDLSTPFTTIDLPDSLGPNEVDNVTFGTVSPAVIPLPAGLPLLLTGLGVMVLLRCRRT